MEPRPSRPRPSPTSAASRQPETPSTKPAPAPEAPTVQIELKDLVRRAQAGDTTALPRIRQLLDEHEELWRYFGDLSGLAEKKWIALVTNDDPLAAESIKRTIKEMRTDLSGSNPTQIEKLLADRVIASYMECKYMEMLMASQTDRNLGQATFRLQSLESAQKRFDNALRNVATVRKALPTTTTPESAMKIFEPQKQVG